MAIKVQVLDNILQMNDSYEAENRRIFEGEGLDEWTDWLKRKMKG